MTPEEINRQERRISKARKLYDNIAEARDFYETMSRYENDIDSFNLNFIRGGKSCSIYHRERFRQTLY